MLRSSVLVPENSAPCQGNFHAWSRAVALVGFYCWFGFKIAQWRNVVIIILWLLYWGYTLVIASSHSSGHVQLIKILRRAYRILLKFPYERVKLFCANFRKASSRGDEANLWFPRSRKNFQHLINGTSLCILQHLFPPRKFIAKWLRRKFNLFMFQVLKVPWTHSVLELRNDCGLNFQMCQHRTCPWNFKFLLLQVFPRSFPCYRVRKLHKSFIDMAQLQPMFTAELSRWFSREMIFV